MTSPVKSIVRPLVHRIIAKASQSYVSGESLEDAIRTSRQLIDKGYWVTLAYWNRDEEAPSDVMAFYRSVLTETGKQPGANYVSIKAPAIDFDSGLYKSLLSQARELKVPLHFDSLAHEAAEPMFSLITENSSGLYKDIGCSLPGRWRRSLDDAETVASLGMIGRVVKGQWDDPAYPDTDPRKGFVDVVKRLAGKAEIARVATHDPELAKQSIDILRDAGTNCELELLYGLPVRDVLKAVKDMKVPVRLYIPHGHAWIPYALNNVRNNPKVLWWLFKDALSGSYIERFPQHRT
jgi:proline dehydrogenase